MSGPRKTTSADAEAPATAAVDFLQWLRPGGPWLLTAIIPDNETETITARDAKAVDDFIRKHDGTRNIYYSVNPVRTALTSKASKEDISDAEFVHADLDPRADETPQAAKARYLNAIEAQKPEPAAIVDSGNGIQALYRLEKSIVLTHDGDTLWQTIKNVEACSLAMTLALGGDAGTQNIDRILRLPGTTNLPTKSKREKGRVACPAKLIWANGATCGLEDFPKPETAEEKTDTTEIKLDWAEVECRAGWLKTVADLPGDFNPKGKMIIANDGNIKELSLDLQEAGRLEKPYGKWSAVSMALAAVFKADGRFTPEQIAAALMCPLACNRHIAKQRNKRRAVERLLNRSHEPAAKRVAHALNWRECRANGSPLPSMHNARLAITELGIECSHDMFHNKILFGYRGDNLQHEMQAILGEVTDNGIIRLRQIMSDRFGFDFEDKATRDAVKSLALEHCFDPVCDMLDAAEANYDGVPRLDRMVVSYLNCDDTPLNRAIARKTMIAAVRRVRKPGCKFDTITVLESPEGWNKSTAWRVLAGDENFSDESILGLRGREVQEQLSEVWIHENADLAGMRKAEVETIKAFASRQSDIARPAFGHFVVKQKRHSIEVGTTNSDEYLQSQTGNRRFWPLAIRGTIDIELLKRDRLQLWGEAAKFESAGESITLDEALWPAAGVEQEKRRTKDPWEDIVNTIPERVDTGDHSYVQIVHRDDILELVASADLLTYVLRIPAAQQETRHSMRLAVVMKLAGWDRDSKKITVNKKQVRGYFRSVKRNEGDGQ